MNPDDDDAPEVIIVNNEGGDPPPEPEPPALPAEVAAAIDLAASQAGALAAERVAAFVEDVNRWREEMQTAAATHEVSGHADLRERLTEVESSLSSILATMETMTSPPPATEEEEIPPEVPVVESGGGEGEPPPPEAPPSQSQRKRRYVLI